MAPDYVACPGSVRVDRPSSSSQFCRDFSIGWGTMAEPVPDATQADAAQAGPRGIRGWLILPAIRTVLSIFLTAFGALEAYNTLDAYHRVSPSLGGFGRFEVFLNLALCAGWIATTYRLWTRS